MNKKINVYLDEVCKNIKCKSVHAGIRAELQDHIEEIQSACIEEGYTEDEALEMAIQAMGDSGKTGILLNDQHKTQTDWLLVIMVAAFSVLGGVIICLGSKIGILPAAGFERYFTYVLIGLGTLIGIYFFDCRKLKRPLYIVAVLTSVASVLYGTKEYGKQFLSFGSLAVSCEYITILYLISFSGILESSYERGRGTKIKCVLLAALSAVLTLMAVGLWQMVILIGAYLILFAVRYMTGRKVRKEVILAISLVVIGLIGAVIVRMFQAGVFGESVYGAADPTFGNLIALFGETVGSTVIAAAAVFILRLFGTIRSVTNRYGFQLALVAGLILTVQFGISILSGLHVVSPLDIRLPFVSYGGTGYICNMVLVGIILSAWRRNNLTS